MIIQDEESGLPFKIISGATVSAPQGVFVKVQPLGVSATWRGNVSQNLKTELSDDYGVSGAYTTGIDTFSVVRGAFTEITFSAGTVIAWYK
jgi:hypothetical protein